MKDKDQELIWETWRVSEDIDKDPGQEQPPGIVQQVGAKEFQDDGPLNVVLMWANIPIETYLKAKDEPEFIALMNKLYTYITPVNDPLFAKHVEWKMDVPRSFLWNKHGKRTHWSTILNRYRNWKNDKLPIPGPGSPQI